MRAIIFLLILCPLLSFSQVFFPAYKNDTLTATCGYKVYKGSVLQIGEGTGRNKNFRHINLNSPSPVLFAAVTNNSVTVTEIKRFWISKNDIAYLHITGSFFHKDSTKGIVDMDIAIDQAIENSPALPGELIVPAQYKNNKKVNLRNNLNNLFDLYRKGKISQAQYEDRKKKLLESQ